ncbi:MAG TPA: hypothetical protein VMW17_16445 [Candidatus Binatia bacterium]|nr:hypothetical protein [Candidatus Binatia bacterium]
MTDQRSAHNRERRGASHSVANDKTTETVLRLEAEYWTIVYQGTVLRLRDSKGLHYLATLLRHPGQRFPATQLLPAAGRPPRVSDDERARMAVTKRIRDVLRKIALHHPSLGYHLGASIRTGHECAYIPDPDQRITWET